MFLRRAYPVQRHKSFSKSWNHDSKDRAYLHYMACVISGTRDNLDFEISTVNKKSSLITTQVHDIKYNTRLHTFHFPGSSTIPNILMKLQMNEIHLSKLASYRTFLNHS